VYGTSAQANAAALAWDSPGAAYVKAVQHQGSDSSWKSAQLTSTPAANVWHTFAGSYNASTSELKVWLNGVNEATTASVVDNASTPGQFWPMWTTVNTGTETAWQVRWSVPLTANELMALARGVCPLLIRPDAITHCYPLWGSHSPEIDLSPNHDTATVTGTSVTNGPPVTLFTPKTSVVGALGTLYSKTLTATSSYSASLLRSVAYKKALSVASSYAATLARGLSISKILTATSSYAARLTTLASILWHPVEVIVTQVVNAITVIKAALQATTATVADYETIVVKADNAVTVTQTAASGITDALEATIIQATNEVIVVKSDQTTIVN